MTPELSRQMGKILGSHIVTLQQREEINIALEKVDRYEDLPRRIRILVESLPTPAQVMRRVVE